MEIAKTILQQLGGAGRLNVMTGANTFVALKNGVTFKIKNRKVNFIKITLNGKDLYDVYFYKLAAGNLKLISEHNDIYFDELIPLFEKETGMYLTLYAKGGRLKKDENTQMILSQLKQIHHHEEELRKIIEKDDNIEPWVIAKMQRATTDLADVTHYEDGKTDKMGRGGAIKNISKKLDELGVKYTISKTKVRLFDEIVRPIDKSDDFYKKFDEVVYLNNLEGVVKSKFAKGGGVGKDYVFVGNTMMNGEYKPVYKKDNKYYLKYYNPIKYNFLADEKDIKNYRIGSSTDTYAKGGGVEEEKPTHQINCDVYYIDEFEDFYQEAVPEYELTNYDLDEILENDSNFLYIEKGEKGFYDENEETFETENGSNTRLDKKYAIILKPSKMGKSGGVEENITISNLEIYNSDLKRMNWERAMKKAQQLGDGWRLPNKKEALMIYKQIWNLDEYSDNVKKAVSILPFLNFERGHTFWTSDEYNEYQSYVLSLGVKSKYNKPISTKRKFDAGYFFLVRDAKKMKSGGSLRNTYWEMVVISKDLNKKEDKFYKDRFIVPAKSFEEAQKKATQDWSRKFKDDNLKLIEVMQYMTYRSNYLDKYETGGKIEELEQEIEILEKKYHKKGQDYLNFGGSEKVSQNLDKLNSLIQQKKKMLIELKSSKMSTGGGIENVNKWEKGDVTVVNGEYLKRAEVVPSYKDDTMRGNYFVVFRNENKKIIESKDNFKEYNEALKYAMENVNKYAKGGGVSTFKEGDKVTNRKGKNRGIGFIVTIHGNVSGLVDFVEEGKSEWVSLSDLKKVNKYAKGGSIEKPKRRKFVLYTNPNNITNNAYVTIGDRVKNVLSSARLYPGSYEILYQAIGTNADLDKAKALFPNYKFNSEEKIMKTGGEIELETPKVYIEDYDSAYSGKSYGQWLDLSNFKTGQDVMDSIGDIANDWSKRKGEKVETISVTDYENIPRSLAHEWMSSKDYDFIVKAYDVAKQKGIPLWVIGDVLSDYSDSFEQSKEGMIEFIDENYLGYANTDSDLAYDYIEQNGGIKNLAEEMIKRNFDYDKYGRDTRLGMSVEEEKKYGYNKLDDFDLGKQLVEQYNDIRELPENILKTNFNYKLFGDYLSSFYNSYGGYYFRN